MGQKINPLGFRLGTTQSHHSIWFEKPKNYSKALQRDEIIRYYVKNYILKNMTRSVFALIHTEIEQARLEITIKIHILAAQPDAFEEYFWEEVENLKPNLKKKCAAYVTPKQQFKREGKTLKLYSIYPTLNVQFIKTEEPYQYPNILAQFISAQLLEQIPVRKAMKKAMKLAEKAKTQGIRIQIAGRIGGREIARVEWLRDGRVPLQTIQAQIDYCCYPIRTIHGVLGIKIWIFIDKKS